VTDRDADAAALAAKMGWTLTITSDIRGNPRGEFRRHGKNVGSGMQQVAKIPAPAAPLHAHLEFVGRIAEACEFGKDGLTIQYRIGPSGSPLPEAWRVTFDLKSDAAADLSHAAIRAALAAKGGAK
jgi:hypothetical protein